ncbi:hypothetical protein LKL35_27350 [Streptomyces sp. ET3-23]|uniref:hypothetical protein n=1 Tax=Streptomyces sp. ET3-23 TaxID=2885643 RepID=UPI001D12603A|nr:hypothetical protein [Streptomyces sp. ET3-23]MCC2279114.1 hypothetical protein [Streptomyces sp. ET3-23]
MAFIAFFVPAMPTRHYKIQIALTPVVAMAGGVLCALVKHWAAERLFPLYCAAMLAMVFAFLGRRPWLRKGVLDYIERGEEASKKAPFGVYVQLVLSLAVMGTLGVWLASASR